MKTFLYPVAVAVMAAGLSSCVEPEKAVRTASASPVGTRFDDVGNVTLHSGQPCTSQIMFDFRGRRSGRSVWLAAPMKQTKLLTEAANRGQSIRVSGVWRRGKDKSCSYVDVATVKL